MQTILACLMLALISAQAEPADKPAAKADTPVKDAPKLVCEKSVFDLGKLIDGEIGEAKYVISNEGTAPLIIDRVRTSCGCTTVKLTEEQKTIQPDASLELPVKFNSSRRSGPQKKMIRVFSNDPSHPEFKLTLKAEVETLINIKPARTLNMRAIRRGVTYETPVEITPGAGETELNIQTISLGTDDLSFTQESFEMDGVKGVKLIFTVDEDAHLGTLSTVAKVTAMCGEREAKASFRIAAQITGDLSCNPVDGVMSIRKTNRGTKLRPITLTAQKNVTFQVLGVDAPNWLDPVISPLKEGARYRIDLAVKPNAPDGPQACTVKIRTDNFTQPVIDLPVFVNVARRVAVNPTVVVLNAGDPISKEGRRIKVATSRSTPFKITKVSVDKPYLSAEIATPNPDEPAVKGSVVVKLTGQAEPGESEATVTIETDVKDTEPLQVQVLVLTDVIDG